MLDSLGLLLPHNLTYDSSLKPILKNIQSCHENLETGDITYKGSIRNFVIAANQHGVKFYGSLAKFWFGNNVQTLNYETTKLALDELAELSGLPIHKALVYRLDVGENIVVNHPALSYYTYFGEKNNMERIPFKHGLTYRNKRRESVFYDKNIEIKKSKFKVDPKLLELNLLRFETRWKGHSYIASYFKVPQVTVQTLIEPTFYRLMISAWVTEYDLIGKYDDVPMFEDGVYRKPSEFTKQLALMGIRSMGGFINVMDQVKQANNRKAFNTTQQYIALKRKVRDLQTVRDRKVANVLLAEVNTKILDVLRYAV